MKEQRQSIIAVIMSTYNGERFLREQIDSILAQRGVGVKLYVRDDGSRDGTPAILEEYADRCENVIFWNRNEQSNVGVARSFLQTLEAAMHDDPDIEYFSFADQDDVWLEDKLEAAHRQLSCAAPSGEPALYYSNKAFVDRELKLIREESIRYYDDFYEAMDSGTASGCTMLFNRAMAEHALRAIPEFSYHDAWVYRMAKACGFRIVFDPKSHILYRQHGDNVTGMTPFKRVRIAMEKLFQKRDHPLQGIMREIYENYADLLGEKQKKYIELIMSYNHNPISWFRLALIPEAIQRGPVKYGIWLGKLIFHIV